MISNIKIYGFRSIKDESIPLKKINIVYGPNGSGKSSVAYASYIMKNFFNSPNQRINSLFNLGFINLGGLENVCTGDDFFETFSVDITSQKSFFNINDTTQATIGLELSKVLGGKVHYSIDQSNSSIDVEMPYQADKKIEVDISGELFVWNGLSFEKLDSGKENSNKNNTLYSFQLNSFYEDIRNIEVISVKRGFFSPIFSSEMESNDESKVAMQIREEGLDFDIKIDNYFSKIFDKKFRFVAIPGSNSFYLRTHDSSNKSIDLVNEGFGINQTVFMLVKLLKKSTGLAFIEEPEIHLHPSAQSKLIDVICEIVEKEDKQVFITTHSENIVSSMLRKISTGKINHENVQFLLAKNDNGSTRITPQKVNDKGQVQGGLMNFIEAEINDVKTILGL